MNYKILILFIISFMAISCKESVEPDERRELRFTEKIELRQLVNTTKTDTYTRGSYFLIAANYSESREQTDVVKVFG